MYDTYGGHLKEIKKPFKRKFDLEKRKKEVQVRIHKYYGSGIHYYISLAEEDNPIVTEKGYQTCWDDHEARGKRAGIKVNTPEEVDEAVKDLFKENFSDETHVLFDDAINKWSYEKWFYGEGD